ncbi:MFS transporter [Granulicatella sp. zg-ZJ]|nr:MFS transporter [Granulicatella sp. zg-ZJ]
MEMLINKNFTKLWFGRLMSNYGDSVVYIVLIWYIMQNTQDMFWVGALNAAAFAPTMLSFLFGNLIDRHKKGKILVILELGQALGNLMILFAMFCLPIMPLLLCAIVFFSCMFSMNTYPVQDAFVPLLVKEEKLEAAQSYMSIGYKIADYLFNGTIGFVLKMISPIVLLLSSIGSFLLSATLFQKIDCKEEIKELHHEKSESVFEGFKIIFSNPLLRMLTISSAICNFGFSGFNVYTAQISKSLNDPTLLGLISAMLSVGCLFGSTFIVHKVLKGMATYQKMIIGYCFFGFCMAIMSFFVSGYWTVLAGMLVSGFFLGIVQTVKTPIIQSYIPNEQLGKVFATQGTISVGIMPVSSLIWGVLANYISVDIFFVIFGIIYVSCSAIFFYQRNKVVS